MIPELPSGLVLAGGRSTRFGEDKAWLAWGNGNLLEHACALLAPVCREVLISARTREEPRPGGPLWPPPGTRVVVDRHPGCGPLAGMEAGLDAMTGEWLLVLPVDMPLASPRLLRLLLDRRNPAAACVMMAEHPGEGFRVFPLLLSRRARSVITARLERGDYRVWAALAELPRERVPDALIRQCDPAQESFQNLNLRGDYERLRPPSLAGVNHGADPGHG